MRTAGAAWCASVARFAGAGELPRFTLTDRRGITLADYPHAQRWFDAINARPAVVRAVQVLAEASSTAPHDDKSRDILFGKTQFARR